MLRILVPLLVLLIGCDDVGIERDDYGFVDNLRPVRAPYTISGDDTLPVEEAANWWNDQIGDVVFEYVEEGGEVDVYPTSMEEEVRGLAHVVYNLENGVIYTCTVTIAGDITYDYDYTLLIIKHELGHCLGLDDDCGVPQCVDLRSIMGDPVDPLGRVTPADRERIREVLE